MRSGSVSKAQLPLHEQRPDRWIHTDDVYGTAEEATRSQLEVFGALAAQTDYVYTHSTTYSNVILDIVNSKLGFGASRLKRRERRGLYVDQGRLADPEAYIQAIAQLDAGLSPVYPLMGGGQGKAGGIPKVPSFTTADYVSPGSVVPIILFDKRVETHREMTAQNWYPMIVGKTKLNDPSVLGIWVTPTYRENLLRWIGTWSDSRKKQIFGEREPETLFISTAAQLPANITGREPVSSAMAA